MGAFWRNGTDETRRVKAMKPVIYENSPYFSMEEVAKHNQNHDGWSLDSWEMALLPC